MWSRLALGVILLPILAAPSSFANTASGLAVHKPSRGNKIPVKDPHEVVITNIEAWNHPTKAVFKRYETKLTKVELRWNGKYPVFHVAAFGGDPTSGAAAKDFDKFNLDILRANGFNAFMVVEDDYHDGFAISYDRQTRMIQSDLVQGVDP